MHASAIFSAPKTKGLNQNEHELFMRTRNIQIVGSRPISICKAGCGCSAMALLMFKIFPGDTRGH